MTDKLDEAANAVAQLGQHDAVEQADDIARAFEAAGERIAKSFETAAERGELSLSGLADSVLNDLTRLAVSEVIEKPLNALVGSLTGAMTGAGSGRAGSAAGTVVNLTVNGANDPAGFARSEGQIAASLARAVSLGQTRI